MARDDPDFIDRFWNYAMPSYHQWHQGPFLAPQSESRFDQVTPESTINWLSALGNAMTNSYGYKRFAPYAFHAAFDFMPDFEDGVQTAQNQNSQPQPVSNASYDSKSIGYQGIGDLATTYGIGAATSGGLGWLFPRLFRSATEAPVTRAEGAMRGLRAGLSPSGFLTGSFVMDAVGNVRPAWDFLWDRQRAYQKNIQTATSDESVFNEKDPFAWRYINAFLNPVSTARDAFGQFGAAQNMQQSAQMQDASTFANQYKKFLDDIRTQTRNYYYNLENYRQRSSQERAEIDRRVQAAAAENIRRYGHIGPFSGKVDNASYQRLHDAQQRWRQHLSQLPKPASSQDSASQPAQPYPPSEPNQKFSSAAQLHKAISVLRLVQRVQTTAQFLRPMQKQALAKSVFSMFLTRLI